MRPVLLLAVLTPQLAWADCVYTGAKRAYLECIYNSVLDNAYALINQGSALGDLDGRVMTAEATILTHDEALATCDSRLDAHDADLSALSDELSMATTDLDARVTANEDDIAAIQTQVDGLAAAGGGGVLASAMVRSDGGNASGPNVNMLTLNLDLSGKAGHWIHVFGGTAIGENGNTSNTAILRLIVDNNAGNTTVVSSQRQGISVYSQVDWSANSTASLSAQGYFLVTPTYAVSNATIRLNGGIDGGSFYWGDQPSYTNYDGELAGAHLGYAVF